MNESACGIDAMDIRETDDECLDAQDETRSRVVKLWK